jgi:hypothetical protein
MSMNPLNDISKIYLEQVSESVVPGKPAEKLGAVTAIPQDERESARKRTLEKAAAIRAKKGIKTEALDPVGKEDADVDNDGKKNTKKDQYLLNRRQAISQSISTQKEAKEVKRWWDDDGDGKGYEEGEVSGKFKKKKKAVKEGFSNWREDLFEVIGEVKIKGKSGNPKIVEKQINNKVNINPKLDLGETVEELGGTLLEMVEIDEVDYIVESVYDELLDEGYEEDDIEEALEYALTEATVTFGHDTPTAKKKGGNLLKAVGRLARQKLSSKVRGAKTAAKQAVATGARKVAKGALGVARKVEGGAKKSTTAERKPSTYRGAGAGQKERVSSGSYTPPTKKKAEKPADPWKGSSTVPQKSKPKPKAEKPADPWEGSATTPAKPKATTKKAAAPKAKAPAAASTAKKKKKSKLDSLLADIRSEQVQQIDELSTRKMLAYKNAAEKDREVLNKKWDKGTATYREKMRVLGREEGEERASRQIKKKTGKDAYRMNALDKLKAAVTKEETQLSEKTLSSAETKEKERIVKSMKDKSADFEKRYPGRGKEVMYATATKMAKKIAEQAMELQPKTQPQPKEKPLDTAIEKQKYSNLKMVQQKQQQLQRQKLNLQRQGRLPLEAD